MKLRSKKRRKMINVGVLIASACSALAGIVALLAVLFEIVRRGAPALDWDFFTKATAPPLVEGGGMANALLGTLILVGLAILFGVPLGILAGVFLSEFGRRSRLGAMVRFSTNVLMGIPSIIVGLFVYSLLVKPMGSFSGWAGAVALAILMLPVVTRTTEDIISLVPNTLRESALALGAPRWRVTIGVVFRAAKAGLITGVLLAVARVSGETAPLLFTCMNSRFWPQSLSEPFPNLTVTIYDRVMNAGIAGEAWEQSAWGACLVIAAAVLSLNIVARVFFRRKA